MQQPAVPELAHTHARPIHWLATATAVAGVVALSSLVQSHEATAAQTPGTGTKAAPAAPAAPPTTAGVDFPLECGPVQAAVKRTATGDVDGDGRPETLAVVHCDAPMGTPPDALYVLTQGPHDTEPRVVATLIDPKSRNTVTQVAVHDGTVRATLLGYSNDSVPACCPDTKQTVKWQWKDGVFVRSAPVNAHAV
ncbi:hypothetical protein ABZ202_13325 [Streptomyces sp. NPDC006186]|uniref:hypothetical protein n=1 Tax=Streptomyces sp. NPDC006186 TaxID=3155248 RepID=UPI0033B48D6B